MSIVFLDTVGMLALWDEADQWHQGAQPAFEKLTAARHSLITTTFVLLECGNAAARRPYRTTVVEWRDVMSANQGLIAPTSADWNEAWGPTSAAMRRQPESSTKYHSPSCAA